MKRYSVWLIPNWEIDNCRWRYETDDINEACDKAYEIEKKNSGDCGSIIRDEVERKWFGRHRKGCAYILEK